MNKEPWVFDTEHSRIITRTIRQRYEMAPYIYTMARKAYDEGLSLCRPMYYDYPEDNEAYDFRNQYMFGDDMLVAPITAPGQDGYATLKIWLPQGEWYEMSTGTMLQGGQVVERSFALDEYPVYVKAGAVLPMYTDEVMNLSGNDETVVVTVFPGAAADTFQLYEDNGNDKDYASAYATTTLSASCSGREQTIVVGRRKGRFDGMKAARKLQVKVLPAQAPQSVTVDGRAVDYDYAGEEFAIVVDLGEVPNDRETVVKITYPAETADMNGLLGATRRMARAMEGLKYRDAGIIFKEEFGRMGSLSEAVMYAPGQMPERVSEFWTGFRNLPQVLQRQGLNEEHTKWFLKSVHWQN